MDQNKDRETAKQLLLQAKQKLGENQCNLLPFKIDLGSKKPRQMLEQHFFSPLSQAYLHSFTADSSSPSLPLSCFWGSVGGLRWCIDSFVSATPSFHFSPAPE